MEATTSGPREPEEEQGSDAAADGTAEASTGAKGKRTRKKAAAAAGFDRTEEVKLFLSPDVRFRLRMLAYKKGNKISEAANEHLDKTLPKWNVERAE